MVRPCYKKWEVGDGVPGRAPHNPVSMVILLLLSLLRGWTRPDLTQFLQNHPEWLRFMGLRSIPDESTWSKLLDRASEAVLQELFATVVKDLHAKGLISFRVLAVDGSFLPGCRRDPDATWGYVRRKDKRALPYGCFLEQEGKIIGLGYRLHALVDADTELPVAVLTTQANVNDVSQWPALWEASQASVEWDKVGWLTGDKGYDSGTVRVTFKNRNVEVVIPAANTPNSLRAGGFQGNRAMVYRKRTSVERFFSMLKRFFALSKWGVTDFARVRKWVLLAVLAWLMMAWSNHSAGRSPRALKAFLQALR